MKTTSDNPGKLFEKFGRTANPGDVIFREGDFGDTLYIIQEGAIEIRKKAGNAFKVLTTLKAGEFFGEMALIDKSPRSATAVAVAPCRLLEVTHRSFEYMLEHNLDFTKRLVTELVEKIRNSNQMIFDLLTRNKKHHVANALVRYSREHWDMTTQGNRIEVVPFLEWASTSIGIEREQILGILNGMITAKKILYRDDKGVKYIFLPLNTMRESGNG